MSLPEIDACAESERGIGTSPTPFDVYADAETSPTQPIGRARRFLRIGLILFALGFAGLNLIAWFHARAMTQFAPPGTRTRPLEQLTRVQRIVVLATGVRLPRPADHSRPEDVGPGSMRTNWPGVANGTTLGGDFLPAVDSSSEVAARYRELSEAVRFDHPPRNSAAVAPAIVEGETWLSYPNGAQSTASTTSATATAKSSGTIILFHGYAATKAAVVQEAREFAAMGWDCYLVDFHGSGDSVGPACTSVGYTEAEDVRVVVSNVKRDGPLVLYGSSMGATAIMRAVAELGVQPDALILECPFSDLLATVGNRFRSMELPAFPLAHLLTFWGGVSQGYWAFALKPREYARKIRCPVLYMYGELDPRVRPEESKRVFENLASSQKTLFEWKSAGHVLFLGRDPGRWRDAVASFLRPLANRSK